MGLCWESLALICTIERFVVPGASAFTTTPSNVPVPFTPGVLGCLVADMIACPCSLSTRCTSAPIVAVCPGDKFNVAGSKRMCGPATCAWGPAAGGAAGTAGVGSPGGAAGGAPGAGAACGVVVGTALGFGFDVGAFTSISRFTPGYDSVPEYKARRFSRDQFGMRTMRGMSTIR